MTGRTSLKNLPRYVSGLGVALGVGMIVEIAAGIVVFPPDAVMIPRIVTSAPFVAGLIYGGYRLSSSSIGVERYERIGKWCLGGIGGFLLVNIALMLAVPPVNALVFFGWVRWAISLGASAGFLIGSFEARAIHREVVAERGRISSQRAETRRDLVDYFDTLLDREIVPRTNAIVDGLDNDGGSQDAAATERQARILQSIVEHASHILDRESDAPSLEPTNLTAVLIDEIADHGTHADATIECDVPEDEEWYVLADRLLPDMFNHLISYLTDRDDRSESHVFVTCEAAPDTMTVRISCEGVTVPEDDREALTDYARDVDDVHASELALVGMLLEYYGGSIEVAESGAGGTVFAVKLRRVTVGTDEQPSLIENRRSASG